MHAPLPCFTGSFRDGKRISANRKLKWSVGSVIQVGEVQLRLRGVADARAPSLAKQLPPAAAPAQTPVPASPAASPRSPVHRTPSKGCFIDLSLTPSPAKPSLLPPSASSSSLAPTPSQASALPRSRLHRHGGLPHAAATPPPLPPPTHPDPSLSAEWSGSALRDSAAPSVPSALAAAPPPSQDGVDRLLEGLETPESEGEAAAELPSAPQQAVQAQRGDGDGVSVCGPSDMWSDAQLNSAGTGELMARLLQWGIAPRKKRSDNIALLQRVQRDVMADPPWAPQAAPSPALKFTTQLTTEGICAVIKADAELWHDVLMIAPVPLERFVDVVADSTGLPNSQALAGKVRQALQEAGVLFTSTRN